MLLRRFHPAGETGGALVLVLIAVFAVAALAASFLQVNSAVTRRQAQAVHLKEALYLAEAGLTESVAGIAVGRTGNVGSVDDPAIFGNGLFWVEATDMEDDHVRLDATGMAGTARSELSTVVERGEVSVASLGIFADGSLRVEPGTVIDGYNSDESRYENTDPDELAAYAGGRLGSNGSIELAGTPEDPTVIHGDVFAGPGRQLTIGPDVTVSGQTGSAYVSVELPPVEPPDLLPGPAIVHATPLPLVIQPGETAAARLEVRPNAEVQIVGPATLRVGSLDVAPGGKLFFDNTQGAIELFVDDGVELAPGALIETGVPDPARLTVQVSGQAAVPLQLYATGQFHGVFYAPLADVEIGSPFEVFGALVAENVTMAGPVRLHYDEGLLDDAATGSVPTVISWRILEMSVEHSAPPGTSPFELLGLDPKLLRFPAEAHEDQFLRVSYLDGGGALSFWQGMESAFDWTDVSMPLTVARDGDSVPRFEEPRGVADTAAASDPALQSLLSSIAAATSSSEVRQLVVDASPVEDQVLTTVLTMSAMDSSDLEDVLLANGALSDLVLGTMLVASPMQRSDVLAVLQAQGSISPAVQLGAIASSRLGSSELRDVLVANSPLSTTVRTAAQLRLPPMAPSDLAAVMAAQ